MRKVKAQLASGTWKRNSFNGVLQRATRTLEDGKYGRLIGGGWGCIIQYAPPRYSGRNSTDIKTQ